ncbi:hypothetical protein [Mannheimia haemolytica]|uniref:Uncharacterized protein n=1 Tax=Mannheimia haemolytica TaxID=75985 RepID=A0A378MRB8_MANHA|nr:hypothetical protein [Mannheimia haemolytica]STY58617.1 Uncharacterised protein [Mannheimia haemolytica]
MLLPPLFWGIGNAIWRDYCRHIFQDERERIKSKAFWFGSILTIIGSLGFIWHGKTLSIGEGFILGSMFFFCQLLSVTYKT